jgi:hypothetical protein
MKGTFAISLVVNQGDTAISRGIETKFKVSRRKLKVESRM